MKISCVWEHNGNDTLLYSENLIGSYTRGESLEDALAKMEKEVSSYLKWQGSPIPDSIEIEVVQEKKSDLDIRDADSDVLFEKEKTPLSKEEYESLKALVLKSAEDFLRLYESVPDKESTCLSPRKTFYGAVPLTAKEMYTHTKNVNGYYFGEIGIDADNEGDILKCRKRGFEALERKEGFLLNPVIEGSYGEEWTLRKVLRRFIWHDRIHAKAMWRMAVKTFGAEKVRDPFYFE